MSSTIRIQVTRSVFDCNNCSNIIERVLQKQAGVDGVSIDDMKEILEVEYDPAQIEANTIEQTVVQWGYTQA